LPKILSFQKRKEKEVAIVYGSAEVLGTLKLPVFRSGPGREPWFLKSTGQAVRLQPQSHLNKEKWLEK
jgi:hypothetical protein